MCMALRVSDSFIFIDVAGRNKKVVFKVLISSRNVSNNTLNYDNHMCIFVDIWEGLRFLYVEAREQKKTPKKAKTEFWNHWGK